MSWGYIAIPVNNASGLRATPVMSASANQTAATLLYRQSDTEMIEEIDALRAFAAATSATGEDAEVVPFDQATGEIENGRR